MVRERPVRAGERPGRTRLGDRTTLGFGAPWTASGTASGAASGPPSLGPPAAGPADQSECCSENPLLLLLSRSPSPPPSELPSSSASKITEPAEVDPEAVTLPRR